VEVYTFRNERTNVRIYQIQELLFTLRLRNFIFPYAFKNFKIKIYRSIMTVCVVSYGYEISSLTRRKTTHAAIA